MTPTRLPLIAGNWKMNTTVAEARALAKTLASNLNGAPGVEVLLCPPSISLTTVGNDISGTTLKLGAQNLHPEPKGAFTGEVSPAMLAGHLRLRHRRPLGTPCPLRRGRRFRKPQAPLQPWHMT